MASFSNGFRLFVLLLASVAVLATLNCSDDDDCPVAPTPTAPRFSGAYALENWTDSGITGGTTTISPDSGSTTTAAFSYDVDLGNPGSGVSHRTARFEVPVPTSGVVTFDWTYEGFHAWCCQATAYFRIFADGDEFLVSNNIPVPGGFSMSGSAAINVLDTGTLGFEIGGANFDSNSRLQGTLTITNFQTP